MKKYDGVSIPENLLASSAFIAAEKHTKLVRFIKKTIPIVVIFSVLFIFFRSVFDIFGGDTIQAESFVFHGSKIVMEKPRLSGFKKDGNAYELTADSAIQDIKTPNIAELNVLTSRIHTGENGWADLKSAHGIYDSKNENLLVSGDVFIQTESGIRAKMHDARIAFKMGIIETDNPVEVEMKQGNVTSDRFHTSDNGHVLVFSGRVHSTFNNYSENVQGNNP